jgi:hypothetical protein
MRKKFIYASAGCLKRAGILHFHLHHMLQCGYTAKQYLCHSLCECCPVDTGLLITAGKGLIVVVGFVWRVSMKNDIKCFHTIDVEINMG